MVADGVGGGDGEDFIQGADAARKGYEDVALGKHQVLAVAEIITRNLDVEVWEGSAASLYKGATVSTGATSELPIILLEAKTLLTETITIAAIAAKTNFFIILSF